MKRTDRMAVVVMPREPLLDWVNGVTPDEPMWIEELADRANVYFIPNFETIDEAEEYVRAAFDDIFKKDNLLAVITVVQSLDET